MRLYALLLAACITGCALLRSPVAPDIEKHLADVACVVAAEAEGKDVSAIATACEMTAAAVIDALNSQEGQAARAKLHKAGLSHSEDAGSGCVTTLYKQHTQEQAAMGESEAVKDTRTAGMWTTCPGAP